MTTCLASISPSLTYFTSVSSGSSLRVIGSLRHDLPEIGSLCSQSEKTKEASNDPFGAMPAKRCPFPTYRQEERVPLTILLFGRRQRMTQYQPRWICNPSPEYNCNCFASSGASKFLSLVARPKFQCILDNVLS